MKNLFARCAALLFVAVVGLSSCKQTSFAGGYGQLNQTQVVLSNANFKVLGSFAGTASMKKMLLGVKDKEGLIAQAKADLLAKAKAGGAELIGSRALINVTVDLVQNANRITATVSADVIEFTK